LRAADFFKRTFTCKPGSSPRKTSSLIPDRHLAKDLYWTLGVQHQLLRDSSIEVRYVGTRSVELPAQMRLNSASAFDPHFASLGGGLTPLPTYLNQPMFPPR